MQKKELLDEYWKTQNLNKKSAKEGVTLNQSNSENDSEFYNYGCRLGNWLADRMAEYGSKPLMYSNVLEVGCGMGRLMFPISTRFKQITGVDISSDILAAAKNYLANIPNCELIENNGSNLEMINDGTFDYVYSSGVFQHIIKYEIIANYIKESLRVLKPNGVFLFSFQAWQTEDIGKGRAGAKITAKKLTETLKDSDFEILDVNYDPEDHVPHICIILKKGFSGGSKNFNDFPMRKEPWRPELWVGLGTCQPLIDKGKNGKRPITYHS